jgi:hypothetical protein
LGVDVVDSNRSSRPRVPRLVPHLAWDADVRYRVPRGELRPMPRKENASTAFEPALVGATEHRPGFIR